ncbi:putative heme-binding domain-containing protein [Haloferula luteola]|uniref:Putative heme-binding domain-containing protein n=1 Tax=Haloferula luteola TaxID=595692 RepID=A0A840VHQ6_9BACT|nr:GDSL-type esterase/lipase family protein [Haloferula luteola]MBB5353370.1 putative heme-binding domain-containing protein [Haloferula luteola]
MAGNVSHSLPSAIFAATLLSLPSFAAEPDSGPGWVRFPGGEGPGAGRHLVFLAGDEEYRSEESLPMLAKMLSVRQGFDCTVLFSVDAQGIIDPNRGDSLGHPESLDSAEAIVMQLRFRKWPDAVMAKFDAAMKRGVPIIGLRTSTHAFQLPESSAFSRYNRFGPEVLGEGWVSHWGHHGHQGTRAQTNTNMENHPLLRGVGEITGPTDVYEAHPAEDATILQRGQVMAGLTADSAPATGEKQRDDGVTQALNEPMMPITWTREMPLASGKTRRVLCTTMGAASDLLSPGLRRLITNGVFWGLGMEIPETLSTDPVGPYHPSDFGFDRFRKGMTAADHLLTASLPFDPQDGARIALVGGSLAARMDLFGEFESRIHARFPDKHLVIRNFARPADEVGIRIRQDHYTALGDPLEVFSPEWLLCFHGFNESIAGPKGVTDFKWAYHRYLDEMGDRYLHAGRRPQWILLSPTAFEPTGNPDLPDADAANDRLRLYVDAARQVAQERGLPFVDLFEPTLSLFSREADMPFTIQGVHLNQNGYQSLAQILCDALFGPGEPTLEPEAFHRLQRMVQEKAWIHRQDHRMLNGWYVYGGRNTYDKETFPREFEKIRAMVAERDRVVWALAAGQEATPDDSSTGELFVPPTNFGNVTYSEPKELKYLTPEASMATMTVPDGFEVQLVASEREFPELAKAFQINFDRHGRLWVLCSPSYPQWKPGDPFPSDRLLILDDVDENGRARRCTTFYDGLTTPMGFEFWNGGVLVSNGGSMLFLKDTDGDDHADIVEQVFDGWATDDSHHTVGAFEWSNDGLLHMGEGLAMHTAVETPWGPHRAISRSGVHILDPRSWSLRHYATPGYGNPWCYVFDQWGNGFVGDGTTPQQHWDSPLSVATGAHAGIAPLSDGQGMRPNVGNEFIISRHFPDEWQGRFVYACVNNMRGLTTFTLGDDGAGFHGARAPMDLLKGDDANFRPADPHIGPDGALYFADWHTALLGHMQYSQRDPNRDKTHARIYRLVCKDRPLLEPVTQAGKSLPELLEQLRQPEWRTRYRARRELRDRPRAEVLAAVESWTSSLEDTDPEGDRLRCEALWLQQSFHAVDESLLRKTLAASTGEARAAALRVIADAAASPVGSLDHGPQLLMEHVTDAAPRARLEAIRGLSFYPSLKTVNTVLHAADAGSDRWIDHTLRSTLIGMESIWRPLLGSESLAPNHPDGLRYLEALDNERRPGGRALPALKKLLAGTADRPREQAALVATGKGVAPRGEAVVSRMCSACHQMNGKGIDFGPSFDGVASRLTREDLVMSIIDPNEAMNPSFLVNNLELIDGTALSGFVPSETAETLDFRQADGTLRSIPLSEVRKRDILHQSSMPEGLGAAISPQEFLDVIEFLSGQK